MKRLLRRAINAFGFDVVRHRRIPLDLSPENRAVLERINGFTMTSIARQVALVEATRHIVKGRVEGCIVECGVWRGGSSMAAALTLVQEADTERHLYLYDTFEGMTAPTPADRTTDGALAKEHLERPQASVDYWCIAGLDDVRRNMASTLYPAERIHYVKGPVEKTIPDQFPSGPIAILRLDTDWYESTKHELIHLFPQVCDGGIVIIDDYGHWEGARKAVDEYLKGLDRKYFLHYVDATARLLVKRKP